MQVGAPVLKLDRQAHKQGQRAGNVRAVCLEALGERAGEDPDIDRKKTKDNIYYGDFRSGQELAEHYENMASEYVSTDKNGKEKRLRSDAGIAFSGIIKPLSDDFDKFSRKKQLAFLKDSLDIVRGIYAVRGMDIDQAVVHVDEGCPHLHYFGYDPEYKLGRKLGLKLYDALNREYPEEMRKRGWPVDSLTGWKEATAGMTEEQKEEYKAKRPKKKHGRSSAEYKAEKRLEKLEAKNAELEAMTDGPVPAVVYRKAQQRKEEAQKQAEEAKAEQQEAEAKRDEAEKQAEEARQQAEEARQQAEASRDSLKAMKAEAGVIRQSVADTVAGAEKVRDYMEKMATGKMKPGDGAIIAYLKANKTPDGKSLYAVYSEKAAAATRRVAAKQYQGLDSVIADAQRRARKLPDVSHIQQHQQEDDGLSL